VRISFSGTQLGALGAYPPTGKRLASEYLAIYRLEQGTIVEIWAEWDNLHSLIQLGHFVPPAA
jgi:predicted ester cyclase